MSNANLPASARAGLVGIIDPDLNTVGAHTTGWISVTNFYSFLAIIAAGSLGASATIDAKLEQAKDGSGTDAKDITGKAITQITANDQQALINLRPEELDMNGDYTHFRLSMTVATASSDSAGFVLGLTPRYGDAAANDIASVAEIV